MNYFEPITKYYIVNILYQDNIELVFKNNNFLKHVKENFPVLRKLEEERLKLLQHRKTNDQMYLEHIKLISFTLNYLNLPRHLLLRGIDDIKAVEPVTGIEIVSMDPDLYDLEDRRVSDIDLENYYISDYDKKVHNFFNPSLETKRRANLSVEEIRNEKISNVVKKRKALFNLRRGMI